MKLKEAFRAMNCLSNKYDDVCGLLEEKTFANVTKTHQLSRANIGEDVVEEKSSNVLAGDQNYDFDKLTDLALALLEEKEKLIVAIEKAKAKEATSFDAIKQINSAKQRLIYRLSVLNQSRTLEVNSTEEFYSKDNDGKQAIYRYPVKTVTSYNIDKSHLRAIQKRLKNECEETSLKLDQIMVSVDVDFVCKFDYDSSIEEIYLDF